MKSFHLLSLLLLASTPSPTVVVKEGETLSQVAERALGDAQGASELKALNGLKDEKVPAGTSLKVPGEERTRAQRALESARNAVQEKAGPGRERAQARLREAEEHLRNARYAEASQAADEAWKLVKSATPTSFSVNVDPNGTTTVTPRKGKVQVEAQNVSRLVQPGENEVKVEPGKPPPPPPPPPLAVPQPTEPTDARKLTLRPTQGGLGPVTLAWKPVEGAERYEVELQPAKGERKVLTVTAARTRVPLSAGQYRWSVRALGKDNRSETSPAWQFEVAEEQIKLELKGSKWK